MFIEIAIACAAFICSFSTPQVGLFSLFFMVFLLWRQIGYLWNALSDINEAQLSMARLLKQQCTLLENMKDSIVKSLSK